MSGIKGNFSEHTVGMKKEEDREEEDVVSATEMTGLIPALPASQEEEDALCDLRRRPKNAPHRHFQK